MEIFDFEILKLVNFEIECEKRDCNLEDV